MITNTELTYHMYIKGKQTLEHAGGVCRVGGVSVCAHICGKREGERQKEGKRERERG